jgi:hypothetical protein
MRLPPQLVGPSLTLLECADVRPTMFALPCSPRSSTFCSCMHYAGELGSLREAHCSAQVESLLVPYLALEDGSTGNQA